MLVGCACMGSARLGARRCDHSEYRFNQCAGLRYQNLVGWHRAGISSITERSASGRAASRPRVARARTKLFRKSARCKERRTDREPKLHEERILRFRDGGSISRMDVAGPRVPGRRLRRLARQSVAPNCKHAWRPATHHTSLIAAQRTPAGAAACTWSSKPFAGITGSDAVESG